MTPRVLIAGCGYLGQAAAQRFCDGGWDVEGWTASGESSTRSSSPIFALKAVDLTHSEAVVANRGRFDLVIHCASTRGGNVDDYRRVYLDGTRHLLAVFPRAHFFFVSSTSVYAQSDGSWVTEESAAEASGETAKVLRAAEELALAREGVVVRLAGICGPKRSYLLEKFLANEPTVVSAVGRFCNQIHRDDAAAALSHLAARKATGVYNVSDGNPISDHERLEWLAARLGRPIPQQNAARAGKRKRGESNKRVSNAKLCATGWTPRIPTFQIAMNDSILPSFGL